MFAKRSDLYHPIDYFRALFSRFPLYLQAELDVLASSHVWKKAVVLKHHAEAPAFRWINGDIHPVDPNLSGIGALQTGEDSQGGGLTATTGTEEAYEFSGRDGQRKVG